MPEQQPPQVGFEQTVSEPNGTLLHGSEDFGSAPKDSAGFGTIPNSAEPFRIIQKLSERKENHILTVREVARLFEDAGVARTERSITNWCQPNRSGVARLDAYFDANDRKYFITPQSVNAAIKEELAKAAKHVESSETFGKVPLVPEEGDIRAEHSREIEDVRFKLRESEIASRMKDQYVTKLEEQNTKLIDQLVDFSRTVGRLETKLLQLESPKMRSNDPKRIQVISATEPPSSS